jgi:hypothetical protein
MVPRGGHAPLYNEFNYQPLRYDYGCYLPNYLAYFEHFF